MEIIKKIFETAKINPLFGGIVYSDFEKMFSCIEAKTQTYKKNAAVIIAGDNFEYIGLILSGCVQIIKEDISGNVSILTELAESDIFGEAFVCAGVNSPVTVLALEESEILFINYSKIASVCSFACEFHSKLIENMMKFIAKKNLILNRKIEILSKRTTREKLFEFFEMYKKNNEKKFTVPYNREEMAQYLCVDRSAMSNELCKMREEGLLKFNKNSFEFL